MIIFVILLFIFLICILELSFDLGNSGDNVRNGIGSMGDSKDKLLRKIEWLSDYSKRVNPFTRIYIASFFISVLVSMVMYNYFPEERILLYTLCISFFILCGCNNFFEYHSQRALPYHIKRNIDLLNGLPVLGFSHRDINIFNAIRA